MPPAPATPYVSIYESVLTTDISKRSSVETFHDFCYAIDQIDKKKFITEVVMRIADFKSARSRNAPKADQENILVNLYETISNITESGRHGVHPARRDPYEVLIAILTIIKNRRSFFKAEYPETLKYVVDRYRSNIFEGDRTRGILACGRPKGELKASLDQLLNDRTIIIQKAEKALASIRIKNTLIKVRENLAAKYPERKYRYLIAQILEQVSNHFEVVPTAVVANYYETKAAKVFDKPTKQYKITKILDVSSGLSNEDTSALDKADKLYSSRSKEFNYRERLPTLKNGSTYSADDYEKQNIKNLKSTIEKRFGSCHEVTQVLILALLSNNGLPDSIKQNICAFSLADPDDHVMAGIKNFEGKTLILDAWLRHTNLKATYGYRPEDVKSYSKDRKTGFMGDIDSYSAFLKAHESERYVKTGVSHQLVEKPDFSIMLKKNINDLGPYLDSEFAKAQPNQLYSS